MENTPSRTIRYCIYKFALKFGIGLLDEKLTLQISEFDSASSNDELGENMDIE